MKTGHRRHNASMSSASGARNSRTMIVTMIAMTPSEKASTRVTPAVPSWVGPSSSVLSVICVLLAATEARDATILAEFHIEPGGQEVHRHGSARRDIANRALACGGGDR